MHTTSTRNHCHDFLVRSAAAAGLTALALTVAPFHSSTAQADQAVGDGGSSSSAAVTDTSSLRHPPGYAIDEVVDWIKSEMAQYRVAHAAELGHL